MYLAKLHATLTFSWSPLAYQSKIWDMYQKGLSSECSGSKENYAQALYFRRTHEGSDL